MVSRRIDLESNTRILVLFIPRLGPDSKTKRDKVNTPFETRPLLLGYSK